jgi:hypothetical protein
MHNYQAFFNGFTRELEAENLYDAKQKAIIHFKPRKSQHHMVHVYLTDTPMSTQHVGG